MRTIIIGDVNEDGTIPPIEEDLTGFIAHARELGIRHAIIPSANLAGTTNPTGIEVIGVSQINELLDQ